MASAAEQLAQNINFGSFAKAKELQKRILFTLGILVAYRIGTYIPVPGIDPDQFRAVFENQSGGILGMVNIFAGGAIERMAIFALNVMPYISASIIMQLMAATIPSLEKLKKEGGEAGRKQINQYSRYLTVILAAAQGLAIALSMVRPDPTTGATIAMDPGLFFIVTTVTTFVGGTMLLLWMGEQITARGVGNGVSLIIFTGIITVIPGMLWGLLQQMEQGAIGAGVGLGILALMIGTVVFVVFIERSQRRILVQYPKRQMGSRMVFNPEETAANLRKYGGFLPGIRPGKRTAEYLDYVLSRLTLIGALYLTIVCLLPEFIRGPASAVTFALGGTSILIVVSVTLDTVGQIQSHLLAHQYEGLIKKTKLRGRRR